MNQFRFLKRTDPGWTRAWNVITERYGDPACTDEDTGESWQYMGTAGDMHEFRHRSLKGIRTYDRVPAIEGDFT